MEEEDFAFKVVSRRCPICQRQFRPKRRHQVYDRKVCRKAASRLRTAGIQKGAFVRRALSLPTLLQQEFERRELRGLPGLRTEAWLMNRAAVIEAEEQIKVWRQRLEARQKILRETEDPNLRWRRIVIRPGEPLTLPDGYLYFGAASTEECIAVVLVGTEQTENQDT